MLEMVGIFTRTLKTTFIWRFLVSFACIALWRIPRSLAKKNTSPRDLPGDRNFPFWVIENRNPSWLSSLLLGRFYPKKNGPFRYLPQRIWKVLRLRVPKKPKKVIEVRSDKISTFFARTPTKKKRLGKQNPSSVFSHRSPSAVLSPALKNHLKIIEKTTDFGWASLALLVWI